MKTTAAEQDGNPARLTGGAVIAALIGAALILMLAWIWGWQQALGRLDPALAVPWLMPVSLWLAWQWRDMTPTALLQRWALFLVSLTGAQAALAWIWTDGPMADVVAQLAVMALASVAVAIISFGAARIMQRGLGWRLGVAAMLLPLGFVTGHALLARLYQPVPAKADAPTALVMTGLPLRWSGSGDFTAILSGASTDDPALLQLEALGPLKLVDSLTVDAINRTSTIVLLHPRAMAPQDLAAVDRHVRSGGRAVILADALSSWLAPHALGDTRNPPITSLLTPLMDHWGITLNAVPHGEGGEVRIAPQGRRMTLLSAGRFSEAPRHCTAFGGRRVLRCAIGGGEAWLVGDADLLQAALWQGPAMKAPHLIKSDVFPWLAGNIWGEGTGDSLLRPLWMALRS